MGPEQALLCLAPASLLLGAVGCGAAPGRFARSLGPASAVVGSALLAALVVIGLSYGQPVGFGADWTLPIGRFALELDALSAWFLGPVAALGGLGALWGRGYLGAEGQRLHWFAYNLALAGMALVLLADDAVLFLMAWEAMSLAGWLLIGPHEPDEERRSAAWIYLVATQAGAAALIPLTLAPPGGAFSAGVFALVLLGFGAKAGVIPLHVWLPGAHAAAPPHVSALMSGALVKMGIYGILRYLQSAGPPAAAGTLLIGLGFAGALVGVSLAIGQRDIKRVLAYSTVENLGLVLVGVGLGTWGWARGDAHTASLGFLAALLHTWNHAAMKGLMFLCAGSVAHATGTRDLDALGGLLRRMPWTGGLMLAGGLAIAGLPPLNGFVGEWLLYLGFFRGSGVGIGAGGVGMLSLVGLLSLVGALAALCFARLCGLALLGNPRSAVEAHDPPAAMLGPMAALAALCVALGVGGAGALSAARGVLGGFGLSAGPEPGERALAGMALLVWAGLVLLGLGLARAVRARPFARAETWGCGYTAPAASMQYTGRSFAELAETQLIPPILHPRERAPVVQGVLPGPARFEADYADPALRGAYLPFFRRWALRLERARRFQHGQTWLYVGYIGAAFVLALAWSALRETP